MSFLLAFFITFIACVIFVPVLTALGKFFCLFATVQECEAQVFLLFGRVIGVIDEPGLHLLALKLGPHALLIRFFGAVRRVDLRLDQEYLRSEPVNSEEGTPMGIGVWFEMRLGKPFACTSGQSGRLSFSKHRSARLPASQCAKRRCALPEQYAFAESAQRPPRNEPPRPRGSFAKVRCLGIRSWLCLHSQGAL